MHLAIPRLALLSALLVPGLAAPVPAPAQVVTAPAVRSRLQAGRSLLDTGRFEDARAAFAWTIANGALLGAGELAAAHFGRGVSLQELRRAGGADPAGGATLDSALADYAEARRLDSATYFVAAGYNAALLERSRGRHAEAARLFALVATAEPPARRGRALVRAARELEALDTPAARDGATRLYQLALAADSTLPDAQLALARSAGAAPATTLASLTALLRDSSQAAAVADAALAALLATPPVPPPIADSLLLLLTRANIAANVSIAHFALAQRAALDSVRRRHPRLDDAVAVLTEGYDARGPGAARRLAPAGWWDRSPERQPDRQRAWSGMMRTIGEWHERAGRDSLAARFYGAALGFPGGTAPAWADLEALLPLVLIHDRRAGASESAARELEHLLDFVFNAKGQAYRGEDLDRIRQFHMTLGAYYAGRRTWEGTPRGAIFQLERMRAATRSLREAGRDVGDPPELLELLLEGYLATGRRDDARALVPALRAANAAAGRADTSAQWEARIERPPTSGG